MKYVARKVTKLETVNVFDTTRKNSEKFMEEEGEMKQMWSTEVGLTRLQHPKRIQEYIKK